MSVAAAVLNSGVVNFAALLRIKCADSEPRRGFGRPQNDNVKKRTASSEHKGVRKPERKSTNAQFGSTPGQAPGLPFDKVSENISSNLQFEERLGAVRRSALEKKKIESEKEFWAIDYDAPVEPNKTTIGLGTKIGVGVAVMALGLVFALGDFLPSGSMSSSEDDKAVVSKLSNEEKAILENRLQQYEATLSSSPKDLVALEGAAVVSSELGKYAEAASLLEDLAKEKPSDPEVFRLLGEVKYALKDYEASATAYKNSKKVYI
ncbi:hypothetical protein Ancab_039890 [Ancistrocladus abbreviatus]